MARELGLNPRKLIKNIPSPSQRWKAPVSVWVREIYQKRFEKKARGASKGADHGRSPARGLPPEELPARPAERSARERREPEEVFWGDELEGPWDRDEDPGEEGIRQENRSLLRRQEQFRAAADYVAAAFARLPMVEKVMVFGSAASPLRKELPRFRKFRRAGITLWHECKDVDLAVWVSGIDSLKELQRARGRAVNDLFDQREIGVEHHQVDVFLMESGTDRYLGRLCNFGVCPKGKPECRVPGCGESLFLRQHEGFVFDPAVLASDRSVTLYDRVGGVDPPRPDFFAEEIPF